LYSPFQSLITTRAGVSDQDDVDVEAFVAYLGVKALAEDFGGDAGADVTVNPWLLPVPTIPELRATAPSGSMNDGAGATVNTPLGSADGGFGFDMGVDSALPTWQPPTFTPRTIPTPSGSAGAGGGVGFGMGG
jgi:hypothetical protein